MADDLYPGYDPKVDPNPVTCWGYDFVEESIGVLNAKARHFGCGMMIITKVRAKRKRPSPLLRTARLEFQAFSA
jgi:hypothetical protein